MPLTALSLQEVLGSPITQGSFAGEITLRQSQQADTVELAGVVQDVRLEEFTGRMQGGPLSGLVNLNIYRGVIRDRQLQFLRFSGELRDLDMNPLLHRYGLPDIGGETIQSLSIAGHWHGGSLGGLSQLLLGSRAVDGGLDVRINSLVVRDNQLTSGNIDLHAEPPTGKPGTIDRQLLLDLLERYLGFQVPAMLARMLPQSVEFVRAEGKLLIDGTRLQILTLPDATSGNGALLTVRIGGQELPMVRAIEQSFDLTGLMDRARAQAKEWKDKLHHLPDGR